MAEERFIGACPCCGHSAKVEKSEDYDGTWYSVYCTDCYLSTPQCETEESAIDCWNLRANKIDDSMFLHLSKLEKRYNKLKQRNHDAESFDEALDYRKKAVRVLGKMKTEVNFLNEIGAMGLYNRFSYILSEHL